MFRYIFSAFITSSVLAIKKDFTFVKFISQLFSSTDESLKDKMRLLLLRWFASDTVLTVVIHIPSVVKPVHIFMAQNRVS